MGSPFRSARPKDSRAGQGFDIFGAGLQASVQRVHRKTLFLTSQFRLRQPGAFRQLTEISEILSIRQY